MTTNLLPLIDSVRAARRVLEDRAPMTPAESAQFLPDAERVLAEAEAVMADRRDDSAALIREVATLRANVQEARAVAYAERSAF